MDHTSSSWASDPREVAKRIVWKHVLADKPWQRAIVEITLSSMKLLSASVAPIPNLKKQKANIHPPIRHESIHPPRPKRR
ncbi:hypothetical protein VTJ04DRAFT_3093 [Mycothermus thermophilus]|uniref:uncharacterized protein n=1 Tax=Humicola insolens TaxID=85995 RepID=UPI003742A0F7